MQAWARQHQQRLAAALTELRSNQELLENLLTWLQWAESNLDDKDKEALPQEIDEVKGLIAEHQASRAADSETFWTHNLSRGSRFSPLFAVFCKNQCSFSDLEVSVPFVTSQIDLKSETSN